jgi:hypothetical protein
VCGREKGASSATPPKFLLRQTRPPLKPSAAGGGEDESLELELELEEQEFEFKLWGTNPSDTTAQIAQTQLVATKGEGDNTPKREGRRQMEQSSAMAFL